MVRLPRNESKHIDWTLGLKCDHWVWLWPWPWPWIFNIKYGICYISTKNGQIWNLLYLDPKWCDCHETKIKYINWTLGLKCDHQIYPWPWPWPWIFKVKYWICHISTKSRGWVGLWGFLWWAPSAKGKDHHGVSSGWSSVWHRSNTGLSSTQYEQIPIILGVWPFWLTPFFFIRPSLDGTYYGMALSVRPSVRPFVRPSDC